jgi:hypothetical protein
MNKIKIVHERLTSFHSDWINPLINEYFDLVPYLHGSTYDKKSTIFYVNAMDSSLTFLQFLDQGYSVIGDSLWERSDSAAFITANNSLLTNKKFMLLQNLNWFWYNESLWYKHLGYDQYQPNRTHRYKALMPMNLQKKHRSYLQKLLANYLDDFVWSYASMGILLPNGGDPTSDWNAQRAFVPDWYDNTCFSIVAESTVEATEEQPIFISEKTFKPIAFAQPFMIYGNTGTLSYLKSQGFETFDNIFDESYDNVVDWEMRAVVIKNNVARYKKQPHSQLTLDKLQHNRELFFNSTLIKQRLFDEIINPIMHHVES